MELINIHNVTQEQTNVSQESILVGCIPPTFVVGGLGGYGPGRGSGPRVGYYTSVNRQTPVETLPFRKSVYEW